MSSVAKKTVAKKTVSTSVIDNNQFELSEDELNDFCNFIKKSCEDECDCEHDHFIIRTTIDNYDLNYIFIYNDDEDEIIVTINLFSGVNYTSKFEHNILLNVLTIDCGEENKDLKEFLKNFHYICSSNYVQITPFDWSMMAKTNLPKLKCFDKLHKEVMVEKINKIGRKMTRKFFECSVCREEISERQKTKCNHGLCFYCYYKLENKICPICRATISHNIHY
jgi:hypothetical protein